MHPDLRRNSKSPNAFDQMAPQVLYRVCYGSPTPSAFQMSRLTIRPAVLHSYCRRRVQHYDYPAIIPAPSSSVRGTFVEGLTDGDLWRLDIFEGSEYTREEVRVKLLDKVGDEEGQGNLEGEEVTAETYVWAEGLEYLEDSEWDFGEFRREKLHRWSGGSEQYKGKLRR